MSKNYDDFIKVIDSKMLQPLSEAENAAESNLDMLPMSIKRIAIKATLEVLKEYHHWSTDAE